MKKQYIFLLIPLLISCANSSSSQKSEEYSSVSSTLSQDKFDYYKEGYSARTLLNSGYKSTGFTNQYIDVSSTNTHYTLKTYEAKEIATLNNVTNDIRYTYGNYSIYKKILMEEELTFANQLKHYPVMTTNNTYITWESTNYANVFNLFSVDDFILKEGSTYSLKIDQVSEEILSSIANQLTGSIGFVLNEFSITITNGIISSYQGSFQQIQTSYGYFSSSITGEFLNHGKEVIPSLTPYEGEEDITFINAMNKLKTYNFKGRFTSIGKLYEITSYNEEEFYYDIFTTKNIKTASYGYIQVDENHVQGVTSINDYKYYDSLPIEGKLSYMLPTFEISSLFFTKSVENNIDTYILKDEFKHLGYTSSFGTLLSSSFGDLIIKIEEDKITFINSLNVGNEEYVYSDFSSITSAKDKIKKTCDELSWSELLSNDEYNSPLLYKAIPQEIIDTIPIFGNTYSLISLNVDNIKSPAFVVQSTYENLENLDTEYHQKLLTNGFIYQENLGPHKGKYYAKDIIIDGQTKYLCVETLLAADFFVQPQFVLYPSII